MYDMNNVYIFLYSGVARKNVAQINRIYKQKDSPCNTVVDSF